MIVSYLARTSIGRAITFVVEVVREAYEMKTKHDRHTSSRDV